MKVIGRIITNILITVWLLLAIFITVCLLSYNEYRVTTFGKYALLIIDSDEMEPEVMEGDLLIIKRNSDNKINVGDRVFYYNSAMDSKVLVYNGVVQDKLFIDNKETTYTIDGEKVSSEYVIGKIDSSKVYHKLGSLLGIGTSKWGFMFIVILPTLFAIIYEIMIIVDTARSSKKDEQE